VRVAPKESKEPKEASKDKAAVAEPAEPAVEKGAKKEKPGAPKGKEGKEPKEGGKSKAKAGPPTKAPKFVSTNPNFRYIVRVSNSDLDGTRPTALALTTVPGVGLRVAETACHLAHVDPTERIGELPEPTVEGIESTLATFTAKVPAWMVNHRTEPVLGTTVHYVGVDLDTRRRDDVNQMRMIRSYRGVRHERGQKVRGQRTRSNGRTGMAAGVLKKTAKEAAAAAAKEEAGGGAAKSGPAAAAASPAKPAAGAVKKE
jgi:small subunit ribosomal protein S13